jgi:hypothetical protein
LAALCAELEISAKEGALAGGSELLARIELDYELWSVNFARPATNLFIPE